MNEILLAAIWLLPASAAAMLGIWRWFGGSARESAFAGVTASAFVGAILFGIVLAVRMGSSGITSVAADLGTWFEVDHYRFSWVLIADSLSLPFALLTAVLVGLIGAFSRRYLHREPGFCRFYLLLCLFGAGAELVILAGSLDVVFIGWELVGLTSALLIAFFHERRKPAEHGLRAFVTYRLCDVGLLAATIWLHHIVGHARFETVDAPTAWAGLSPPASTTDIALVGLLMLWASMGKAAQVPIGGWLPRAMEGPTPSSAIFYGGISVHLGAYLLLRAAPMIEASFVVRSAVVTIGALTALHATFVGRVQTDIKSALAYASMTQVGLVFVEVGLGLYTLAVVHIIGHAILRSLQFLRAPSLLHDHHHLEQAMSTVLPRTGAHLERLVPATWQPWLYRHALERGYFDAILREFVVRPVLGLARRIDTIDAAWTTFLARPSRSHPTSVARKHGS